MRFKLVLGILCGMSLQAAVLFNTGPPNGNASDFVNMRLADAFQFTTAASVDTIDFWYQVDVSGDGSDLSDVAWAIYQNSSGSLGGVVASGDTAASISFDATNNAWFAQLSIPTVDLSAGIYWLELHGGSSLTDDNSGFTVWWAASDAANVYNALMNGGTGVPDTSINAAGYETYAFELQGTQDATAPEPGTLAPVALGAALIAWRRKRP